MVTMRELVEIVLKADEEEELEGHPQITDIFISDNGSALEALREGRWIKGNFERSIRIDKPTDRRGLGQPHAHVFGRNGEEVVVVNLDGTGSHGSKGRLTRADADALTARGFQIRPDRVVEWRIYRNLPQILFG